MKKITRNTLASPIEGVSTLTVAGDAATAVISAARKVRRKPKMNFGKRSQISPIFALP